MDCRSAETVSLSACKDFCRCRGRILGIRKCDDWKRAYETTKGWRHIQTQRRDVIFKDSIDIELDAFSGVGLHNDGTRLRAQAYQKKLALRRRYSPKLEEQMAELLAEKLGPSTDLDDRPSPTSARPAGRRLRLSIDRQQQQTSPILQRLGPVRGRHDASISRLPSSSGSSNSTRAVSVSSSESSSRSHTFPSAEVNLHNLHHL
jgi:histone-lysine N-methyltransferase SUV39H